MLAQLPRGRESIIFGILYHCACSEGELIHLKRKDIDFQKRIIHFSDRKSAVPGKLLKELEEFSKDISDDDFLVRGRNGPMSAKRLQQIVTETSQLLLGKKITPQEIRSIHIAHALMKDISPASISRQAGLSYQRIAQIMSEMDHHMEETCYPYEL